MGPTRATEKTWLAPPMPLPEEQAEKQKQAEPSILATFGGGFTPKLPTILGPVMHLRQAWIVGNTGLAEPDKGCVYACR
jgi:hypothetical protein